MAEALQQGTKFYIVIVVYEMEEVMFTFYRLSYIQVYRNAVHFVFYLQTLAIYFSVFVCFTELPCLTEKLFIYFNSEKIM